MMKQRSRQHNDCWTIYRFVRDVSLIRAIKKFIDVLDACEKVFVVTKWRSVATSEAAEPFALYF